MRRSLLVLLAPLVFGAAVAAQTQGGLGISGGEQISLSTGSVAVVARVSPDEVVSRLLTFDRDRDGKVAEGELAERMQPLMARGDSNRDGALDAGEIRALAAAPPPPPAPRQGRIGGPFGGSYGFADEDSFSSRNHVDGAIEDLKLADDAREQVLSIAKSYVDKLEADAAADLVKDLEGVATPQQLASLQQMLKSPSQTLIVLKTKDGTVTRQVVVRPFNPRSLVGRFGLTPEQNRLAAAAVDRFRARVKMGESERAALLDQLKGVLPAEERDNLRAALARRPVVATGGVFAMLGLLERDLKAVVQAVGKESDPLIVSGSAPSGATVFIEAVTR